MSASEEQPPSDDQVRVGNVEREHVVELLQSSVGGGYLTLDEFEQRVTQVHESTTRGQLRAVLADLPAGEQSMLAPRVDVVAAPGGAANPEVISADWTATVRRRGKWHVPPALQLEGSSASIELDFTECQVPPTGVDIHFAMSWTTVKIRVPAGMPVDTSGFEVTTWSTLKDKTGEPVGPVGPGLRLTGKPSASTVVLRRDS